MNEKNLATEKNHGKTTAIDIWWQQFKLPTVLRTFTTWNYSLQFQLCSCF